MLLEKKSSSTLELTSEGQEIKFPANLTPQILGNQMVLPIAGRGVSLGRGGGVLAGRGRGMNAKSRKKGLMNKLTAIEEDEAASMAASHAVATSAVMVLKALETWGISMSSPKCLRSYLLL